MSNQANLDYDFEIYSYSQYQNALRLQMHDRRKSSGRSCRRDDLPKKLNFQALITAVIALGWALIIIL